MTCRATMLVLDGRETELYLVETGIPQGSPVSPILFLLYSSELLNICNPADIRIHAVGFVDDVNLIAWG
jgi:hypothetical protein